MWLNAQLFLSFEFEQNVLDKYSWVLGNKI